MIRLAFIGVGAVTQELYLPAMAGMPQVSITHLADLDLVRCREVAAAFNIPHAISDFRELFGQVDAVVLATPPGSHAPLAVACLENGLHVLCEKPLTTSTEAARRMIDAARAAGRYLAVAMVRRLSLTSELLHTFISTGMLGRLERITIAEGYEFRWPLRTGHLFQDSTAGGVLIDTGTHLLDLMFWASAGSEARLIRYRDDSWGGVAANAIVECEVQTPYGTPYAEITLSFSRPLSNTITLAGEHGRLIAPTLHGGTEILFYPAATPSTAVVLRRQDNPPPRLITDQFALQVARFAETIATGEHLSVPATDALPTISLIEQCHTSREMMVQPWERKHLESFFGDPIHA